MTLPIVVIGGGVAGLAAASALAEAGRAVLVLEARGALGGRATAFNDRVTGELVDNGQHVMFGCYHETLAFLRRIGAEENVYVQPTLEVTYMNAGGRRSVLKCPRLPSPFHLLGAVLRWDALSWRDRAQVFRLAAPLLRARRGLAAGTTGHSAPVRFDASRETVGEWLTRHGQHGRLRDWLWEPLAVAALNQSPDEAAAAPFVRVLAEMFGPDRRDASIVLPVKPLEATYASPARRFIESKGGAVRTNALARVRLEGGRVAGVDVRGEQVDARLVIAAVPWFALEGLLIGDVGPMRDIASAATRLESKPIVTVNLWYDRTVMEETFVGLPGRAMQWVFDKRHALGGLASHLSLVSSGADALVSLDNEALVALAAREIAEGIPGARGATLVRGTVIREKRATFSLAPGQPPRPGTVTPIAGLLLAGDWTNTGLPGTIESAAISGHAAARTMLRADS